MLYAADVLYKDSMPLSASDHTLLLARVIDGSSCYGPRRNGTSTYAIQSRDRTVRPREALLHFSALLQPSAAAK